MTWKITDIIDTKFKRIDGIDGTALQKNREN